MLVGCSNNINPASTTDSVQPETSPIRELDQLFLLRLNAVEDAKLTNQEASYSEEELKAALKLLIEQSDRNTLFSLTRSDRVFILPMKGILI